VGERLRLALRIARSTPTFRAISVRAWARSKRRESSEDAISPESQPRIHMVPSASTTTWEAVRLRWEMPRSWAERIWRQRVSRRSSSTSSSWANVRGAGRCGWTMRMESSASAMPRISGTLTPAEDAAKDMRMACSAVSRRVGVTRRLMPRIRMVSHRVASSPTTWRSASSTVTSERSPFCHTEYSRWSELCRVSRTSARISRTSGGIGSGSSTMTLPSWSRRRMRSESWARRCSSWAAWAWTRGTEPLLWRPSAGSGSSWNCALWPTGASEETSHALTGPSLASRRTTRSGSRPARRRPRTSERPEARVERAPPTQREVNPATLPRRTVMMAAAMVWSPWSTASTSTRNRKFHDHRVSRELGLRPAAVRRAAIAAT